MIFTIQHWNGNWNGTPHSILHIYGVWSDIPIQTGKKNLRKINDLYLVSTRMPQISFYT